MQWRDHLLSRLLVLQQQQLSHRPKKERSADKSTSAATNSTEPETLRRPNREKQNCSGSTSRAPMGATRCDEPDRGGSLPTQIGAPGQIKIAEVFTVGQSDTGGQERDKLHYDCADAKPARKKARLSRFGRKRSERAHLLGLAPATTLAFQINFSAGFESISLSNTNVCSSSKG